MNKLLKSMGRNCLFIALPEGFLKSWKNASYQNEED